MSHFQRNLTIKKQVQLLVPFFSITLIYCLINYFRYIFSENRADRFLDAGFTLFFDAILAINNLIPLIFGFTITLQLMNYQATKVDVLISVLPSSFIISGLFTLTMYIQDQQTYQQDFLYLIGTIFLYYLQYMILGMMLAYYYKIQPDTKQENTQENLLYPNATKS